MEFKEKIAFITGSSKGIGAAIAIELAQRGAKVVINGLEEEEVWEKVEEINSLGGSALAIPGDITEKGFSHQAFQEIEKTWGMVNILVNNAGVEVRKPSLEYTDEDFDYMMDVNLKAAFFLTQQALPNMIAQKWGRIINISSVHESKPKGIGSVYSMSKAGMAMMTKELALEYSQFGITINNIAPGAIRTDMNKEVLSDPAYEKKVIGKIPSRVIGEVEDVAKLTAFVASDEALYVNGTTLYVDGGMQIS